MATQPAWVLPQKPADLAEKQVLSAILDGTFPIGDSLPPERELAQSLGITRPTLREALQRLARDGWIQIQQGKSTIVKDYWKEGNLIMLNALSTQPENLSPAFMTNLLEVRAALAPVYTRLAYDHNRDQAIAYLEKFTNLPDNPETYAQVDMELHHQLTILSGNPIFTLIYNGFRQLSYQAGLNYFANPQARRHSHCFYCGLLDDYRNNDPDNAEARTAKVMQDSLEYWNSLELGKD